MLTFERRENLISEANGDGLQQPQSVQKPTVSFAHLFLASAAATAIVGVLAVLWRVLSGAPTLSDLYAVIWSRGGAIELFSVPWWFGVVAFVFTGLVIAPVVYWTMWMRTRRRSAALGEPPREPAPGRRGFVTGSVLWFLTEMWIKPLAGLGMFSTNAEYPLQSLIGSFVLWNLYGWVMEAYVHPQRRFIQRGRFKPA